MKKKSRLMRGLTVIANIAAFITMPIWIAPIGWATIFMDEDERKNFFSGNRFFFS